jgi:hypothetical protein
VAGFLKKKLNSTFTISIIFDGFGEKKKNRYNDNNIIPYRLFMLSQEVYGFEKINYLKPIHNEHGHGFKVFVLLHALYKHNSIIQC